MKYIQSSLPAVIVIVVLFAAIGFMNVLGMTIPIKMINTSKSTELSVVGEATVEVVPTTAIVVAGISVQVPEAEAAEQQIAETNNAIIAAVTALGIPEEQIETQNFSVQPSYSFESGAREISGYQGTARVEITTEEEGQIEEVIAAATNAGANEILDTRYEIGDMSQYQDQARDEAIADAKMEAERLSETLGIRLGRVTNFVESSAPPYQPYFAREMAFDSAVSESAVQPEIQPGTDEVTATVTLFFEIH